MQPQTLQETARFYNDGINTSITRGSGERVIDILKFLQEKSAENDRFLKDTTINNILSVYVNWTKYPIAMSGAFAAFSRMLKKNIVIRYGSVRRRSNFRINYLNPAIPAYMLANATDEEKAFVRKTQERMESLLGEGKEVRMQDDVIVYKDAGKEPEEREEPEQIVTEPVIGTTPEPVAEPVVEPVTEPVAEPVAKPAVVEPVAQQVEVPQTVTMPVRVDKTDSGINLTITLNLNLNK